MKKWIYQKKKNNKMNEYDTLDKGDTNKICEYIGEQANGIWICNIFW